MAKARSHFAGRLEYLGWSETQWLVRGDNAARDFKAGFWRFIEANKGARAKIDYTLDGFELLLDPAAPTRIAFENPPDCLICIERDDGVLGWTNVTAYLEHAFCRLNARHVVVKITRGGFTIWAAPGHEVFGISYGGGGNSGVIPPGTEVDICKLGKGPQCCIFLTAGPGGFACEKFGSLARSILDRKASGKMHAGRIGDCALMGREREGTAHG